MTRTLSRSRLIGGCVVLAALVAAVVVAVVEHGDTAGASNAAGSGPGGGPRAGTVVSTVRPVRTDGAPATGYAVGSTQPDPVTCSGPASPSAVDDGIGSCGYTALGLLSCWRSTGKTALCLTDVTSHTLTRVTYTGAFAAVRRPAHPAPQLLVLAGGTRCTVRDGGAWDALPSHPSWVGAYYCGGDALYGPPAGNGIDTATAYWQVDRVAFDATGNPGAITVQRVDRAYLVGTAA